MKIGILTFHDTSNYGAILQAVATYKALRDLGYNCEIIDYHCEEIDFRENPYVYFKRSKKNFMFWIKFVLRDYKKYKKYNELHKFLIRETKVSDKRYDRSNISEANSKYDLFIVGSDMLWCTKITQNDYSFFLDFVDQNKYKIAYATSVGDFWKDDEIEIIRAFLDEFNQIALREKDTANAVSRMLNIDINNVCDPTMLISTDIWNKFLLKKTNKKKYCLKYMSDVKNICGKDAKDYARANDIELKELELKIVGIPRFLNNMVDVYSIEEFLTIINNAEILFTASFHGMLFAIYFHIPFVYYNKDSARLDNLAQKLGLEYRNGNKYNYRNMKSINWEDVDERKKQFSEFSLDILKRMIDEIESDK